MNVVLHVVLDLTSTGPLDAFEITAEVHHVEVSKATQGLAATGHLSCVVHSTLSMLCLASSLPQMGKLKRSIREQSHLCTHAKAIPFNDGGDRVEVAEGNCPTSLWHARDGTEHWTMHRELFTSDGSLNFLQPCRRIQ